MIGVSVYYFCLVMDSLDVLLNIVLLQGCVKIIEDGVNSAIQAVAGVAISTCIIMVRMCDFLSILM